MLNYKNILKGNDIHVHKLCIYWHNAHGQLGTGAHQSASKLHHPVLRSRSRKLQVQRFLVGTSSAQCSHTVVLVTGMAPAY